MNILLAKKLRSSKGASIFVALLLLLVCMMVASVVIASASAASGRLSELATMDQRYYSVTSAAELLRDLLEGEEVTFTQTRTDVVTTETNRYNIVTGEAGVTQVDETADTTTACEAQPKETESIASKLASYLLLGGSDPSNEYTWDKLENAETATAASTTTPLSFTIALDDHDGTSVTIKAIPTAGNAMDLELENTEGTDKYKLSVQVTADISSSLAAENENTTSTTTTSGTTVTETTITTSDQNLATTVTWAVSDPTEPVRETTG